MERESRSNQLPKQVRKRHPDIIYDDSSFDPSRPIIRRTNVSPDNPNVIIQGPFYHVGKDMNRVPLGDYMDHGYESRKEFREAIEELIDRWGGRDGECIEERAYHGKEGEAIDERHIQLHLRFPDTPGARPDQAWLPRYLLTPIPTPEQFKWREKTEKELAEEELHKAIWGY